jgi:hypothetical protein
LARLTAVPASVRGGTSACVRTTLAVDVVKADPADRPWVFVGIAKYSSTPPAAAISITPSRVEATLAGSSEFHFEVCPAGAWAAGAVKLVASILQAGPPGRFRVLQGENEPDEAPRYYSDIIAEIRVEP